MKLQTRSVRGPLWILLSVLGLVSALTGCSSPEPTGSAGELADLRVGVATGVVAEATVMELRAAPSIPGVIRRVSFQQLATPDQIRAAFAAGTVDIATMPTTVAANLANRDADLTLLGVVDARLLHLLGPAGAPTTWQGLRGKTVHLPFRGDAADTMTRYLLAQNGLTADRDVRLAYHSQLPELTSGLAAGQFEYAVLPEHMASLAVRTATAAGHPTQALLDLQQEWQRGKGSALVQTAVVIRGALARERPGLVRVLQEKITGSVGQVRQAPNEAASRMVVTLQAPEPVIAAALARLDPEFRTAGSARTDIEELLKVYLASNPDAIGGGLPSDDFYGA
ncbi:hypothetical protein V6U90_28315 [Micromonospora sp. CPCC 206060]|uniref:ABC transporter substrate-binding protein n=1 Tax=Micromonospora sp. CPCC 206060 TaxID=3122406 RepID=UPI002FF1DCE1